MPDIQRLIQNPHLIIIGLNSIIPSMIKESNPKNDSTKPILSRRRFSQIAGAGIGASLLAACSPSSEQPTPEPILVTKTEEQRLSEHGLREWSNVLDSGRRMRTLFGADATQFKYIVDELENIATGGTPTEIGSMMKIDDWNKKTKEANTTQAAVTDALNAIPQLGKFLSGEATQEQGQQGVRNLETLAKIAPAYIMALAKRNAIYEIHPIEGYMNSNGIRTSITGDAAKDMVPLIHELQHFMDAYFLYVREYLSREAVINYISSTYEATTDTLIEWALIGNTEQAIRYKYGVSLLSIGENNANSYVGKITERETPIPDILQGILDNRNQPSSAQNSVGSVFSRLDIPGTGNKGFIEKLEGLTPTEKINEYIRTIIRNYVYIKQYEDQGNAIPEAYNKMRNDSTITELVKAAISEVSHIYVGPQQRVGGGLYQNISELPQDSMYLTLHNAILEAKRMHTFMHLSANDSFGTLYRNLVLNTPASETEHAPAVETNTEVEFYKSYGFKHLNTAEFEGNIFSLMEAPEMPAFPNRKVFYIQFPTTGEWEKVPYEGILLSVLHDRYDPDQPHDLQFRWQNTTPGSRELKIAFNLGISDPVENTLYESEGGIMGKVYKSVLPEQSYGVLAVKKTGRDERYYQFDENLGVEQTGLMEEEHQVTDFVSSQMMKNEFYFKTLDRLYHGANRYFSSTKPVLKVLGLVLEDDIHQTALIVRSSGRSAIFIEAR